MTRIEFMNELESLLSDIPIEEREEALQYYNDYFEDAGADHEEEVLKELVSPQRVAAIIKADLSENSEDRENRGYFTEKGYQDTVFHDEKFEIVNADVKEAREQKSHTNTGYNNTSDNSRNFYENNRQEKSTNNSQTSGQTTTESKKTNVGLIIVLCILAIPFGLPIFFSVFGVMIGIVAAILGIIFGFGVAGVALMGAGVALFIIGLIKIGVPFLGLLLCGSGLIILGLGMLFTFSSIILCKKVLPALVRGFVNLCRLPFRNRSVAA